MGVWSPFWLLQLLQENGSPLDAAHLLLAPEPSGEEASHLEGSQPPGGGGVPEKVQLCPRTASVGTEKGGYVSDRKVS